jgi:hypothetical protein
MAAERLLAVVPLIDVLAIAGVENMDDELVGNDFVDDPIRREPDPPASCVAPECL